MCPSDEVDLPPRTFVDGNEDLRSEIDALRRLVKEQEAKIQALEAHVASCPLVGKD